MKTIHLMSPMDFCYWLNGFAELTPEPPTAEQWKAIKEHLALVFTKVTPKAPGNDEPPPDSILHEIFKPRPPKPLDDAVSPWRDKMPKPYEDPFHLRPQIIC